LKDNDKHLKINIPMYICVFFTCCVVGWCFEVPLRTYIAGFWVFPGFLYGCYLPIYGVGAIIMIIFFEKLSKKRIVFLKINFMPLVVFLGSMLLLGIMEYIASYLLEVWFDLELWGYRHHRFHINGRVSLEQSTVFGLAGTGFIYLIYPPLKKFLQKRNPKTLRIIATVIVAVVLTDIVISVINYLK